MSWTTTDIPDQTGKLCIITGANTGLGLSNARMFAEKGASVIMACRNAEKANAAAQGIRAEVPKADVRVSVVDVASLASVREFAARINAECERIDLLINNAGVMVPPLSMTSEGFESQFVTNYLGHFLLTGLLLPLLEKAAAPRVVSLSSIAAKPGKIDFDNLNAERGYSRTGAYSQSKLACLMYAIELQRRLTAKGSKILSTAAHPGGTRTELGRHVWFLKYVEPFIAQDVDAGAMPTMRAATDPEARGGDYYGPAGFMAMKGPAVKEQPVSRALDVEVAKRFWKVSEQLSGISYL